MADLCAIPVQANHSANGSYLHPIKLHPPRCVSNLSIACSAHRSLLQQCPIVLSHSSTLLLHGKGEAEAEQVVEGTRQRKLVTALATAPTANSLAIVGDSMARQAFMALVARLRDQDHALDYNVHHALRLTLFVTPPSHWRQRVVDTLSVSHRRQLLPQLDLPLNDWAARAASAFGKVARARSRTQDTQSNATDPAEHRLRRVGVEYFWAPCAKDQGPAAADVAARAKLGGWAEVVLFAPAFWHLTGNCGKKPLNATAEGVMHVWAPWIQLHRPNTRYTVVNVPVENVLPAWKPHQLALNDALTERFAAGSFPPNWRLFDWAALTAQMNPPTVVPHGDQKRSWHYVCQLYRQAEWYTTKDNHPPVIMTRAGIGDCGDTANTVLWETLLLERQRERGERKERQGQMPHAPTGVGQRRDRSQITERSVSLTA